MAITGLLVHALKEDVEAVERAVAAMPEMTSYGIHQEQYVVVVAEAPSDTVEKVVEQLDTIEGVLAVYTTYLTVEDEIDKDGNLKTNLSLKELCKHSPQKK
ncbi:chaperone NapD [Desulfomarina sp.]